MEGVPNVLTQRQQIQDYDDDDSASPFSLILELSSRFGDLSVRGSRSSLVAHTSTYIHRLQNRRASLFGGNARTVDGKSHTVFRFY